MKKILKICVIFIISSFLVTSCEDGPNGSTGSGKTMVEVDLINEAGFCELLHEGTERSMDLEINVDALNSDGSIASNFGYDFFSTTNDFWTNESDYRFEVEVPKNGAFAITVTLTGIECFNCCEGNSCDDDMGKPKYRGVESMINGAYDGEIVDMTTSQIYCL